MSDNRECDERGLVCLVPVVTGRGRGVLIQTGHWWSRLGEDTQIKRMGMDH